MGALGLRYEFRQKRKIGWEWPSWFVLLFLRLNLRVSWEWMEMTERLVCRDGVIDG